MVNGMSVINIILNYGLKYAAIYIYTGEEYLKNLIFSDSGSRFIKDLTYY